MQTAASGPHRPSWRFERAALRDGFRRIAGVDECGRGCLAGPVVAAAVRLRPGEAPAGVDDSKRLRPDRRERLFEEICACAEDWAVASVGADEIDRSDILTATVRAMSAAIRALGEAPDYLLTDHVRLPGCGLPYLPLVKGDQRSVSIAAASIVAKVVRDRMMREADERYPGYGFARHKGYGTAEHRRQLRRLGTTPLHRMSFRGVAGPAQGLFG